MVTSEFIANCIAGEEDAIQQLIRTHQRMVFQLALSILDHDDAPLEEAADQAEIATHETFLTALHRLPRYRDDVRFNVWLTRIAIEVSQKRFRFWQRKRRLRNIWARLTGAARHPASAEPSSAIGEDEQGRSVQDAALWQIVARLDDRLRLPVILRYFHELPVNEIAAVLHLREGAVHARLDQAREKLAQAVTSRQ